MHQATKQFLRDQSAATAIEYGLLAALIAVAIIGTLGLMGTNLKTLYAGGTGSAADVMANAIDKLN